jgi:transcriptional regulator with XRE-family HTH domain
MRRKLDEELRPYRQAAKDMNPTNGLLRVVRRALGVPVAEIAKKLDVAESVVFAFEARESSGRIGMGSMDRVAGALGCKLVYAIVPRYGQTLEELAEERLWQSLLRNREREDREGKSREQGSGVRDQKDRNLGTRDLGTGEQDEAFGCQVSDFDSGDPGGAEETGDEEFSEAGLELGKREMDRAGAHA